jgi:alpha-mannosidase
MERVEKKYEGEIPVWNDELYLEYHRGTYTTQGEMKRRNRRMESSLESAEKFATLAAALVPGYVYPDDEIDGAWLRTLFNQFHDILPGSSIPDVYVDARADYDEAETMVAAVGAGALKALAGRISAAGSNGSPVLVFNPLSWTRSEVVCVTRSELRLDAGLLAAFDADASPLPTQVDGSDLCFLAADVPGIGYRTFWIRKSEEAAETLLGAEATDGRVVVQSAQVRAVIDTSTGDLRSVVHVPSGHEMLRPDAGGGNVLQLLGDIPSQWDAWNIGYTGEQWSSGEARVEIVEDGPLRVTVRATRTIGNSELVHDYVLQGGSPLLEIRTRANWDEEHKLLKTAFQLRADTEVATFEIPYGTIDRPTRPQTEAGKAKWEVAGNRWVDLSDRSGEFGLTLIDDSKYGYDISGQTLRLTLLRAPKYPDPKADIGEHEFAYALYPHEGGWRDADSYRRGTEYNVPLEALVVSERPAGDLPPEQALVSTGADHVVLSALKAARDGDTRPAFVLRIHEVEGRSGTVEVHFPFPIERAYSVNLMEDRDQRLEIDGERVKTSVGAYGLQSVLVEPR